MISALERALKGHIVRKIYSRELRSLGRQLDALGAEVGPPKPLIEHKFALAVPIRIDSSQLRLVLWFAGFHSPYLTVDLLRPGEDPIEVQSFWWGDPIRFDPIGAVSGIQVPWQNRRAPSVGKILDIVEAGGDPYKELLKEGSHA